jgi:HlyD family secretion protein
MKRLLRVIMLVGLAVTVAVVGAVLYRGRTSSAATAAANNLTQIIEVRSGNLSTNVTVVGELDAEQLQNLTFSRMTRAAKITKLDAKVGSTVKAGQVLAAIDPAPYQQTLDQAKSALQAAEENLTDLKTPPTKLDIAKADLAVAKADLQLQQAQTSLDDIVHPDMTALQALLADAERAAAQAKVDLAKLQVDKATEDNLTKLRDAEAKASAQYERLAGENTPDSDSSYRDRLQISLNALRAAQDARVTAETQQQANIVKAQMQVNKTGTALADAKDALATAQAGGDKLALAKAKVAVQDAQVALAVAKDARTKLDQGTDAATLAAAQADVDKKRLAVGDAQANLTAATIVAPFDCTILQSRVALGDLVAANTTIATVANLKTLQVLASVDETTIRRVTPGQSASMTFDAFPGQSFRGKVLSVPLQGALQNNVMVYQVPLSLTGADNLPLLVGMTANVQIQVGQANNALLIPALALQQVNGAYQVLVPSDDPQGEPKAVTVEVGLSDGVNTQITRGLKAGDKVIVKYSTSSSGSNTNQNQQQNRNEIFIQSVPVPGGNPPAGGPAGGFGGPPGGP